MCLPATLFPAWDRLPVLDDCLSLAHSETPLCRRRSSGVVTRDDRRLKSGVTARLTHKVSLSGAGDRFVTVAALFFSLTLRDLSAALNGWLHLASSAVTLGDSGATRGVEGHITSCVSARFSAIALGDTGATRGVEGKIMSCVSACFSANFLGDRGATEGVTGRGACVSVCFSAAVCTSSGGAGGGTASFDRKTAFRGVGDTKALLGVAVDCTDGNTSLPSRRMAAIMSARPTSAVCDRKFGAICSTCASHAGAGRRTIGGTNCNGADSSSGNTDVKVVAFACGDSCVRTGRGDDTTESASGSTDVHIVASSCVESCAEPCISCDGAGSASGSTDVNVVAFSCAVSGAGTVHGDDTIAGICCDGDGRSSRSPDVNVVTFSCGASCAGTVRGDDTTAGVCCDAAGIVSDSTDVRDVAVGCGGSGAAAMASRVAETEWEASSTAPLLEHDQFEDSEHVSLELALSTALNVGTQSELRRSWRGTLLHTVLGRGLTEEDGDDLC